MPWFKVDDGFHGHPKVVELSLSAVGIWTLAGSWSAKYLTDGLVSLSAIQRMGGDEAMATELVNSGLWVVAEGGYEFKDWGKYQPLKVDIEAERDAAQDRMRSVRAKKKGVRANETRTDPERSDEHIPNTERSSDEHIPVFGRSSADVRVTPSHPIPSQSRPFSSKEEKASKRGTRIDAQFSITDEMRKWGAAEVPLVNLDSKLAPFIDYWIGIPGQSGVKLDWLGTWRNNMRKQQEFAVRDAPVAAPAKKRFVAHAD